MKFIVTFCALCALWGCRVSHAPESEEVALSCSTFEQSKTDVLTSGDQVGVFACIAGTEQYFLEHAKYTVGSDGRSLSTSPTVYYPDRKDAVAFTAYLPFGGTWSGGVGTFSVPSDQSTAAALKQADLCWATACSTPAKSAVPLQFEHKLARLLITTNIPTTKLVASNVFSGGTLDIRTGTFTNTTKSTISTTGTGTGTELILPAQTITRLVLTVAGVEYVFEGVISLEAAKTTTVSLTLNAATHAATFAGVTTTAWGAANKSDAASRTVNNQFTVYWLVADSRFSQINKIGLTVKDETSGAIKEYPVSQVALVGGSTMASASYTFALANVAELHYPYTVSAIQFYKDALLVHRASVGNVVARPGAATLGSGQNIALTLSADKASVAATVTSSTFALTSNVPYGSSYTSGGASAQGSGLEPPYANRSIVFTYPAQGLVAAAARTHVMTIAPTVDYTGSPNKRTFTVTQAAVPTALTISAAAASVAATVASSAFTLTSNAPYGSTYTSGGASAQGSGTAPPYTNRSVVFTYPAQGAAASAARQHVMTITPTVDYTGTSNKRTFTVTQAAVPTALTISAAAPGEAVPVVGKTYLINVTANTSWKSQSAVNGVTTVPASGTGNVTGVKVVVPATSATATRTVSIDFITTAALSGVTETIKKWSGTQESAAPPNPTDYVKVGNVYWATGNLVASSSTAGAQGVGGCKIGAPGDHGLYFQFGSLIGYKGGALANGGSGVGSNPYIGGGTQWWGGKTSFSWANDAMVYPPTLSGNPGTVWPQATSGTSHQWFFSGNGVSSGAINATDVTKGVGDPCTYYLGGTWRLPTTNEYVALCNNQGGVGKNIVLASCNASWTGTPVNGGNFFGTKLFIPASGYRSSPNGSFTSVTGSGFYWSSSVYNAPHGLNVLFTNSWASPQSYNDRSYGFSVRCVSN